MARRFMRPPIWCLANIVSDTESQASCSRAASHSLVGRGACVVALQLLAAIHRRGRRILRDAQVHGEADAPARVVREPRGELTAAVAVTNVVADLHFAHLVHGAA